MDKIKEFLFQNQDIKYRDFTSSLIPNIDKNTVIGVKTPILRKYVKKLNENTKKEFLKITHHNYHEENIIHSLIISDIKDYDLFINYVDSFLPYVTNWAVCDVICNKYLVKYRNLLIDKIYSWLKSDEVYRVRYAIKCLMNYYLAEYFKEEHITKVLEVELDDYYVKMMIAWYLATGLAKNYESFIKVIESKKFDKFIHNKAIQKAIESYRVSDLNKSYLKELKIK